VTFRSAFDAKSDSDEFSGYTSYLNKKKKKRTRKGTLLQLSPHGEIPSPELRAYKTKHFFLTHESVGTSVRLSSQSMSNTGLHNVVVHLPRLTSNTRWPLVTPRNSSSRNRSAAQRLADRTCTDVRVQLVVNTRRRVDCVVVPIVTMSRCTVFRRNDVSVVVVLATVGVGCRLIEHSMILTVFNVVFQGVVIPRGRQTPTSRRGTVEQL